MSDGMLNGEPISIIPINHNNKRPLLEEWGTFQKRQATPEEIAKWKEDLKPQAWAVVLGDVSGRLYVMDVDSTDAESTVIGKFVRMLPETLVVETSPGKRHFYFRSPEGEDLKTRQFLNKTQHNDERLPHVDLKANGGYVLLPGSRHPAGHVYRVIEDRPVAEQRYEQVVFILKTLNKHWPIIAAVSPQFLPTSRNLTIRDLAGFLWHHAFSVEEAIVLAEALCFAAGEDDFISEAVTTVQNTYARAEDGVEVGYHDGLTPETIDKLEAIPKRYSFSSMAIETAREEARRKLKRADIEEKPVDVTTPKIEKPLPEAEQDEIDPRLIQWLETATYQDIRNILKRHIFLPEDIYYDEILLISNQSRIKSILPVDSVVYIAVTGEYSSAKTYMTRIATFLSDGEMVVDPTEAYIRRQIGMNEGMTLGIDEVDELMKTNSFISSLLRMGTTWVAMWGFVEKGEKGKLLPKKINIGSPKVFNGYSELDEALMSRTLRLDMKRYRDIDMIVEKMLGHPKLKLVREWLRRRCETALTKWNPDAVEQLLRSDEFKAQVEAMTKSMKIPRGAEIIIMLLLLGKILDIDAVEKIVEHYINSDKPISPKGEIYKDTLSDIYHGLSNGLWVNDPKSYGFESDHEQAGGHPFRINKDKLLEVQTTYLWRVMNLKLGLANRAETIQSGHWPHVLGNLKFVRKENWLKETSRGKGRSNWRGKSYVVFDEQVLQYLGVEE